MDIRVVAGVAAVWVIIFAVPIAVYGVFSAVSGLQPPGESPMQFLLGTAVSKLGTAVAFVLIWYLAREIIGPQWLLYVGIWWLMFVLGEVGQAIGPSYSLQEAIAGVISESIYLPLSGLIVSWLVR
jgi:hypothetical protein